MADFVVTISVDMAFLLDGPDEAPASFAGALQGIPVDSLIASAF